MLNIRILHYEEVNNPVNNQVAKVTVLLVEMRLIISGIRMYRNPQKTWMHIPAMREITETAVTWHPNVYFADEAEDNAFKKLLFDAIIAYEEGEVRDVG
jgi:Ni,Fe-hydrogenase I cytochrome b subunit